MVAALATAYVGVPALGLKRCLLVTCVVSGCDCDLPLLKSAKPVVAALVLLIVYSLSPPRRARAEEPFPLGVHVLERVDSRYGHLIALEDDRDGSRVLLLDGTSQNWAQGEGLGGEQIPVRGRDDEAP